MRTFIYSLLLLLPMTGRAATHDYVDLGLPSATLWATCNVGANAPEEYGSYFAWGETSAKSTYSWKNYKMCKGTSSSVFNPSADYDTYPWHEDNVFEDAYGLSGTAYDAATNNWEDDWKTPTINQIKELLYFCTATNTTQNGVNGVRFTGPNGKSIFMPYSGYKYDSKYLGVGEKTFYWSANYYKGNIAKAKTLSLDGGTPKSDILCWRRTGLPIRPVKMAPAPDIGDYGVLLNDAEFVDLGLHKQWATQNIGATSPEQQGRLYAWGEIVPKPKYTWANYTWAKGSAKTVMDIGDEISRKGDYDPSLYMGSLFYTYEEFYEENKYDTYGEFEDDEIEEFWAEVYDWFVDGSEPLRNVPVYYTPEQDGSFSFFAIGGTGGGEVVCMPTQEDFKELIDRCQWQETTMNGVKGYQVTGPNGNSIFLPFGGCSYDGKMVGNGIDAYYWSGTLDSSNKQKAKALYVKNGSKEMRSAQRRTGIMIRPVLYEWSSAPELPPSPVDLGLSIDWDAGIYYDIMVDDHEESPFFAWGEIFTKDEYTWENYEYAPLGTSSSCVFIGSDISGTEDYDAASFYSEGYYDDENDEWHPFTRLPTAEEFQELLDNCTFVLDYDDGHEGYRVTGPSGESIFMPFLGCSYDGSVHGEDDYVYFWTSNNDSKYKYKAKAAYLNKSQRKITSIQRRTGAIIWPVVEDWDLPSNSSRFDTDGIRNIKTQPIKAKGATYTLQGIKVEGDLKPGIYIRNGKKIIVK